MTPAALNAAIAAASKGDEVQYHRGNLALDRKGRSPRATRAAAVGDAAWAAYLRGRVSLVQRVAGPVDKAGVRPFHYIAVCR